MHAKNPKRFKWLWDEVAVNRREAHGMRSTILSALGRISDEPKVIEAFALRLCKVKPTAAEAVVMLRNVRLNKLGTKRRPPKPLAEHILAAVRHYQRHHPDTTDEMAREALHEATAAVEAALAESCLCGE